MNPNIEEEEQEMFKLAEKIGEDELDSLGDRMNDVANPGREARPVRSDHRSGRQRRALSTR